MSLPIEWPSSQERSIGIPRLGVGAEVVGKFGPKKPFTARQLEDKSKGKRPRHGREDLRGAVLKSAADSSWIV
eukprot:CAMPEP_0197242164 /NCGR_PEP_ID=MMETSP1429-20130617/8003_1 /TAXON_ID=49237 /ORGANISM="Chaetoceros  sp., Strain UNC1202" /LENGTH=72 /DNA_ID=CAMNT_0042702139 /DNA_START=18 /DNA_END=233 /DNA_ORIENTATION=-